MNNKLLFLWVLGLAAVLDAAELGLEGLKPAELKEIEKEIAAGNVPPNYTAEKPKRLVPKLTNADGPQFNHLGSSNVKPSYTINASPISAQQSFASQGSIYSGQVPAYTPQGSVYSAQAPAYTPQSSVYPGQAPALTAQNSAFPAGLSSPLRLVYNNQYFPNNQYLPYLQNPQIASQIAAQYSYPQSNVPHYLQTPTQIQYVSPPSFHQVPSAQFKALNSKAPAVTTTSAASSKTAPTSSQPTSQVLLPSNMAAAYQHQPVLMFLYPQQQQPFIYPGHQMLLVSPQSPLLNLYGQQHRFNLPYNAPATANQLTYLTVPGAQQQLQQQFQQQIQQQATAVQEASDVQKQPINVQESSASQTYGLRTKA